MKSRFLYVLAKRVCGICLREETSLKKFKYLQGKQVPFARQINKQKGN